MNVISKKLMFLKRYGIKYSVETLLRDAGLKKREDLIDNIPIMKYYQSLSEEQYPAAICEWYQRGMGKKLNLENPRRFTEKIQWLKLYDSTPLKSQLADKYLAPLYVREKCGDLLETVPQYGAWVRAEDIDFDELPEKFVLKCNHGSGMNIIVTDKSKLDIEVVKSRLNKWMEIDFAHILGVFELHYTGIERKIIAEKFIEEMDGNLHDYKIHCFNGKPEIIQVIGDRDLENHEGKNALYDINWNKLEVATGSYPRYECDLERPKVLDTMLKAAEILAEDFAYVRVDLYVIGDKPYFGELTFTPRGGFYPDFNPPETDEKWGDMLILPKKVK